MAVVAEHEPFESGNEALPGSCVLSEGGAPVQGTPAGPRGAASPRGWP